MQNTKKLSKIFKPAIFFGLLAILYFAFIGLPLDADATSITLSYGSQATLQQGIIVQLLPKDSSMVEPVSIVNEKQAFGVVVGGSSSTITLSNNSASQQVYVVNNGDARVLVSDQNGSISTGDYITVSNINGVGMKADSTQPIVIGQALQTFNGSGNSVGSQVINYSKSKQTVQLGLINVRISIAQNPLLKSQPTPIPAYLQKFSYYAVGKVVSPLRIYLGIAILLIILVISSSMIYSATRSSIISLGRNPLSKKIITRGFLELVLIAIIILISGVFGVYLLLKV